MSKIGKRARALRKQQKQINKLQKRLAQAGTRLDLTSTNHNQNNSYYLQPKKQLASLKKYKRELQTTTKETKTKNTNKITEKQLKTVIEKRKQNIARHRNPAQSYVPTGEALEERKITNLRDKLRKNIQSEYTPPKPAHDIPVVLNTDTSFFDTAIISNYKIQLQEFPAMLEPMLRNWLDWMILEHGEHDVAVMLQKGAEDGNVISFEIAYSEEKIVGYISEMLNYLPEMTDWYKAEIMEQFEVWDDIV